MKRRSAAWLAASIAVALAGPAWTGPVATDDAGETVTLIGPARRIVTLAPHATELARAAGAGAALVATVGDGDEPADGVRLPRIGDAAGIDREALIAARPDLVVAWGSASRPPLLQWLRRRGVAVYVSEPRRLDDVARSIAALAGLAGTKPALPARPDRVPPHHPPVRALFLFWDRPPIAAGGSHVLADVLRSCGAEPVYADIRWKAATLSPEALVAARPDLIFHTAGRVQRRSAAGDLVEIELTVDERRRLAGAERPGPSLYDAREVVCGQVARAASR